MKNFFLRAFLLLHSASIFCMHDIVLNTVLSQPQDSQLEEIRERLSEVSFFNAKAVCKIDPTIVRKKIALSERPGVCYNYAMVTTLKKYGIKRKFNVIGCQDWIPVLTFFKNVKTIKKDDIAAYFFKDCNEQDDSEETEENSQMEKKGYQQVRICHLGIVVDSASLRIESKFGTIMKAIYTHNLFALPQSWGDGVSFLRLKKAYRLSGVAQDELVVFIKETMEDPLSIKQLMLNFKLDLLRLAAGPERNRVKIAELLEQCPNTPLNCRNHLQETPLIIATKNNMVDIVILLLKFGANKQLKDMYARTALDNAVKHGNKTLENILRQ